MIGKIFPADKDKLVVPALLDIIFGPIIALIGLVFVLAAGCSNTIVWRGIKYKLNGIMDIEIEDFNTEKQV